MQPQYSRAERAVWRRASGGVLVLPSSGREVVALTGTGEDAWDLLSEAHTAAGLAQRLAERYDAPCETIMTELAPILDDLTDRGVLVRKAQQ